MKKVFIIYISSLSVLIGCNNASKTPTGTSDTSKGTTDTGTVTLGPSLLQDEKIYASDGVFVGYRSELIIMLDLEEYKNEFTPKQLKIVEDCFIEGL